MSDDLTAGLAATAGDPAADSTPTIDTTLDAVFEPSSEGAAPSEPSGQTAAGDPPAAAIPQPPTPAKPETQPGEPPKERWDTILANARTKARDEALAEHKNALEIFKSLQSDLPGTLAQLLEEAAADARFSEAITTKAAALLNARKQKGKEDDEPQPDAVMKYEDGTTEPTYSPAQQRKWNEWRERQFKRQLTEEFKPLLDLQQQFTSAKQQAKDQQEAFTVAERRGASWKAMPFFEDHKTAILERQQALYADAAKQPGFDPLNGPWDLLQQAYAEVVTSTALPTMQAKQTEQLVADAAKKRAGSSSDPAAAAPAQPRRPRTPDEALDQVFDAAYAGA